MNIMDKKKIAKYALQFIGGKPRVDRYYNRDESKQIDIMISDSGVIKGVPTCSTIGLSETDIGLYANGKKLRVELMAVCELENEILCNILSTIAFDVKDSKSCGYGMIIPNAISNYDADTELKHAVLMSPVFWPEYKPLEDIGYIVVWLMVVPITDSEKQFIEERGIAAFDVMLEKHHADVINIKRKTVI